MFPLRPSHAITKQFTVYEQGIDIQPKRYKKVSGLVSVGFGSTHFNDVQAGFWERNMNVRFGFTYLLGSTLNASY